MYYFDWFLPEILRGEQKSKPSIGLLRQRQASKHGERVSLERTSPARLDTETTDEGESFGGEEDYPEIIFGNR